MTTYYYDDIKHELKKIDAFDEKGAKVQALNFWNVYSKSNEVKEATLFDEELEIIEEFKK